MSSNIDLPEKLADSGFTKGFIIEKLCENHEIFRRYFDASPIKQISADYISEGMGFESKIYRIKVDFSEHSFSCILKAHPFNAFTHNSECRFYSYFSESTLPTAKIYSLNEMKDEDDKSSYILMEYLNSCFSLDFPRPEFSEQVKTIIKHITDFHIYQLQHPEKSWKSRFKLDIIQDAHLQDPVATRATLEWLKEYNPKDFGLLVDKIMPIFQDWRFTEFALEKCCDKLEIPKVVNHGDIWEANIMWKNETEIRAIIDFGCVFEGNPMNDFAKILRATDTNIRRFIEKEFLESYYKQIRYYVKDLTFEKVNLAYNYIFVYQTLDMAFWVNDSIKNIPENEDTKEDHRKKILNSMEKVKEALKDIVKFIDSHEFKETYDF